MRINEITLPKNQWELLISTDSKEEAGDELVNLVKNAYSNTPMGSFVHSMRDVIPSDWNVIDWDKDPDVDACIFHRRNRPGESWNGQKIQGIGHDGASTSKQKAITQLQQLLTKPGWWLEGSDAMRTILNRLNVNTILNRLNVNTIDDEKLLQRLFNDPGLRMIQKGTYQRRISTGLIVESVFGYPQLKEMGS
jgi:hypothetical protein